MCSLDVTFHHTLSFIHFYTVKNLFFCTCIRDKVFKSGPSKICGRQPLKNLKRYGLPEADFKYFKGCLPKILLGPLLNALSHLLYERSIFSDIHGGKMKLPSLPKIFSCFQGVYNGNIGQK